MYSHRGAFLQALAMVAAARLTPSTVSLWTLPMFHCNGWCFPWAITAAGALHVGLRRVAPERIWQAIREEGVTHFNAAPTVLIDLAFSEAAGAGASTRIHIGTGGAPPSPRLLSRLDELNRRRRHNYAILTEELDGCRRAADPDSGAVRSGSEHILRYDPEHADGLRRGEFIAAAKAEGVPIAPGATRPSACGRACTSRPSSPPSTPTHSATPRPRPLGRESKVHCRSPKRSAAGS
jgi:acyl-CoA synthetase (AMP-forming)/AMP-acid ligase II